MKLPKCQCGKTFIMDRCRETSSYPAGFRLFCRGCETAGKWEATEKFAIAWWTAKFEVSGK